jgi:hypothetical protein
MEDFVLDSKLPRLTPDPGGSHRLLPGAADPLPGLSWLDEVSPDSPLSVEQHRLIDRARRVDLSRRGVRELIKHLPDSDEELDQIFTWLIRRRDENPFAAVWSAALEAGRRIDSRHLVDGYHIVPFIYAMVHHLEQFDGDLAENVLATIRDRSVTPAAGSVSLLALVFWCRRNREGVIPPEVLYHIRTLAREPQKKWKEDRFALVLFCGLVGLIEDAAVNEILEHENFPLTEENRRQGAQAVEEIQQRSILTYLSDRNSARIVSGGTVKCETRKPGRNDPCHCGSAKKYKKCCEAKDRQNDMEAAAASGLVIQERPALTTKKQIHLLSLKQAYELDLMELPPELRPSLLVRLWIAEEFERIGEHCRALPEEIDPSLREMLLGIYAGATMAGQKTLARILAESLPWLGPEHDVTDSRIFEQDAEAILNHLESCVRESIEEERPQQAVLPVLNLLTSGKYPALAVLLARSVIACNEATLGESVVKVVRDVLDANHWNPYDPAEDILEMVLQAEEQERKTNNAVEQVKSQASAELEAKRAEIRQLEWELKRTRNSLKTHQAQEREAQFSGLNAHSVPEVSQPVNGKRLREVKELRERVSRLQDELRQRHGERNEMRRSLHEAQETLARKASDRAGDGSSSPGEDEEEDLLLDHSVLPNWPARFPVWPPDVRARRRIPDAVWRTALQLSGRLAAGDPGAVHGVKVLKGLDGIYRQRMAGSWRLLFELDDQELRIIDLIPRRDLVPWARARASR